MADTVLSHVTSQNRPFNAQNVADALGKHGIKKGAAQKYLEQLVDAGKIAVKDAGKQKVFFALQDGDVLSAETTKAMEFEIKEKTSELSEAKQALAQKHAALRQLGKTLTVEQMRLKTDSLAKQSGALETKLAPLRIGTGDAVSPETLRKTEDAFIFAVEQWQQRKRKFTDAFETILDSTGATKKKMGEDIGVEVRPRAFPKSRRTV
jgi:26S proteasome regulatory subunit (ATPase 3-interacting protein)